MGEVGKGVSRWPPFPFFKVLKSLNPQVLSPFAVAGEKQVAKF